MDTNTQKRIWLDNLTSNNLCMKQIGHLIAQGYTIIMANTAAVDSKLWQKNVDALEDYLQNGCIIIEDWNGSTMCSKQFFWSSCSTTTEPAESMLEAVVGLPNAEAIMELARLVSIYAIPKGQWAMGPWTPPAPISLTSVKTLGLHSTAVTRTDVLVAAMASNRMDLFDEYNRGYCHGLATQHCCVGIINSDGTITFL